MTNEEKQGNLFALETVSHHTVRKWLKVITDLRDRSLCCDSAVRQTIRHLHRHHYIINEMLYISKALTQLAFSAEWYHNIFNGWHFFTVEDIYFFPYVLHLLVWSGLRSEVVLIRHLCVRTYKQAAFVCEINQLQVQQMLVQPRSGRHLCFTQVRPERWHLEMGCLGQLAS